MNPTTAVETEQYMNTTERLSIKEKISYGFWRFSSALKDLQSYLNVMNLGSYNNLN
ncbi:hypothetical protein [Bacillus sp. FSL K6-3431]|uniref:hypothetical protein n=1 Tax=Bacillus sp. FSL K6-3431 TaxID=2921500 RepID=UPI0030F60601